MADTPSKFKALIQALSRPFRGTGANATAGWVPRPLDGTATTDVLRADATWGPVSSSGGMASFIAGTGLDGGTITNGETLNMADTAVTPGSYTYASFTVDQQGRLTAAASGTPSGLNFSDDEAITGAIDGVNADFVLAHTPDPANSLQLFWNGVCLKRTVGYTLSTATVTMQAGYVPATGDTLSAFFRY